MAYRFAVETDFDGSITSIKFVGLRGESPVFCWDVPYSDRAERDLASCTREGATHP